MAKHGQASGSETGFLWLCLICIRYLLVYVDSWDAPSGDACRKLDVVQDNSTKK